MSAVIVEYGVNVSQTRLEKLGTETEADSLIVFYFFRSDPS